MLTIPCSRPFTPPGKPMTTCRDGQLCGNCAAIRILKATCLGAAHDLEQAVKTGLRTSSSTAHLCAVKLRADVARVDGVT